MPPALFVAFEVGTYVATAFTLYRVAREDRYELLLLLAVMGFAVGLERAGIRSSLAYYYNPFLLMIGERPGGFPLCVGLAWGLLTFSAMRTTRGLLLPWWWLPGIDALLAVLLELVLDLVVAADRVVTVFGEWCAMRGYPRGPAPGVGFWMWCVPEQGAELLFGIPLDNFVACFVMVCLFSMLSRLADRRLTPRQRPLTGQLLVVAGVALVSYFATLVTLDGYGRLVGLGVSEALVLGSVLLVPGAMLAVAGGARSHYGYDALALVFPAGVLGFCWWTYFATSVSKRADSSFLLFILGISAAALCAFLWLMKGRAPPGTVAPPG